jgi:hypothetical protein
MAPAPLMVTAVLPSEPVSVNWPALTSVAPV